MYIMYPSSLVEDKNYLDRIGFEVATKNFKIGDLILVDDNFDVILVQNGKLLKVLSSVNEKYVKLDKKIPGLKTGFFGLSKKVTDLRVIYIRKVFNDLKLIETNRNVELDGENYIIGYDGDMNIMLDRPEKMWDFINEREVDVNSLYVDSLVDLTKDVIDYVLKENPSYLKCKLGDQIWRRDVDLVHFATYKTVNKMLKLFGYSLIIFNCDYTKLGGK